MEAQEQTKRFNILNDAPGIKADLKGWSELANDAKNLNKELENLENVPSALITSHILLRDWSRHNLQVIEDYITYLETENDSYRVSANLAIERTNNIWPEFVSNFDEVLRKYEIKQSDLQ